MIGEKSLGDPIEDGANFQFPFELPDGFEYLFERFSWNDQSKGIFECEFRVNANDVEMVDEWIRQLSAVIGLDWKPTTGARSGRIYTYRRLLECQHAGVYRSVTSSSSVNTHGQ